MLSLLLVVFASAAGAENLLPNAGFEHGLAGYMLGDAGDIRNIPYHFDKTKWGTAITFTADPKARVALYLPEVPYLPDTEYKISFMAKSSIDNLPFIVSEYVRAKVIVGSAGKFFPKLTTEWKHYSFTFKTGSKEKWGGFRLIKNNHVNKIPVELSFADIYLGPVTGNASAVSQITGSLDWDPLDRRILPGENVKVNLRLVNSGVQSCDVKVQWRLYAVGDNTIVTEHQSVYQARPGVNEFPVTLTPGRNGVFRMEAMIDGKMFLNHIKFAVTPKIRIRPGELPVDIGVNGMVASTGETIDKELAFLADSGISFIRAWGGDDPLLWRRLEPEDGHFFWTQSDRLIDAVHQAGLEIIPVLGGMFFTYPDQQPFGEKPSRGHAFPQWLYQKSQIVSCPPNMKHFTRMGRKTALPPMDDWERMVGAVARRYKGKIHYYEIMNEPNLCLTPEQYLPYLKTAHRILKETDPQTKVIGICATGDYDGHIIRYVDEMLRLGAGKYFDDLSFHPYNNMYEDSPKSGEIIIESFYKFLNENNLKDVKLWNTELFYLNPLCSGGSDHINGPIYHPGYLIRRYLLDAAQGVRASLLIPGSQMFEPALINDNFQGNSLQIFFSNRLLPTEKYIASAVFATLLKDCTFNCTLNIPDNIRAYCFSGKTTAVAAFFALHPKENDNRRLEFPILPQGVKVLDYLGNPIVPLAPLDRIIVQTSPIPRYVAAPDIMTLQKIMGQIKRMGNK